MSVKGGQVILSEGSGAICAGLGIGLRGGSKTLPRGRLHFLLSIFSMKTIFLIAAAAATLLFSGCETASYGTPSFGSGAEPRDATSPTGTITDNTFMR